jgi:amino acid adenylation domain-containing protein
MSNLHNKIEAIYPLSPMQQGLLFHSLYSPGSGTYGEQVSCRIERGLDVEAFKRSWQSLVDRHSILRTSFLWEGLAQPQQVVHKDVKVVWKEEDWRHLTAVEHSECVQAYLAKDREVDFEFSRAPLMRLTLLRTGEDTYYFIWSSHHILLDGWCRQQLFEEVFVHYEVYRRGKEIELACPRPYRDYIAWLKQQDLKRAEDFWRSELRGFTSPTVLPGDRGLRARREERLQEQLIRIGREMTSELDALARSTQVTMGVLIQGVWALILSRYSGQEDVVFGMTVSGRSAPLPEIESMIGLFINTLPVRVQISGVETVRAFLKHLQARQAKALAYEYTPLMDVQSWSEIPRGASLFDSLISFQNYPVGAGAPEQTDSTLQISDVNTFTKSHFPLVVLAVPGTELFLHLAYDAGRFEDADILRVLQSLRRLLVAMATSPEQRLGELEMLTAAERQQMLVEWNATTDDADQPRYVTAMFEKQVERAGEAIAVVSEEGHLSYAVLNEQANRLAHYLQRLGVGPEVRAGICVERSLKMVVGLLGILKAGGAYVPLDPDYPPERLAYMLEDSAPAVLLTHDAALAALVGYSPSFLILNLDSDEWQWAGQSERNPDCASIGLDAQNLAYIIYTSGSTGKPKGVAVSHLSICNHMKWIGEQFSISERDCVLQKTPFTFDASVWEFYAPLLSGGQMVIARQDGHRDPAYLIRQIEERQVSLLQVVPSLLSALVDEGGLGGCRTLRAVFCGGEALSEQLQGRLQEQLDARLVNLYGPTEVTIDATYWEAGAGEGCVAIGRPVSNTQAYVLGERLEVLPVGVQGELYLGGAQLARGYLNQAGMTGERFVPNPFSREPGGRLYRTGDRVRWRSDGNLEFVGRVDEQIKLRGYRIELGEIEAALEGHEAVRQCAVRVREEEPGDKRLVAYVVATGQRPLVVAELRTYLQERLPTPMIPWVFVEMSQLPLTTNGKLDRKALPSPIAADTAGVSDDPHTPLERTVAGVWREVLKLERVGAQQNFFELGGHSLLATQVIVRLRHILGIKLQFRILFDNPTVAGLAEAIAREGEESEIGKSKSRDPQAMKPVSRNGYLPLSFAQQRLWFVDQLEPESIAYNTSMALRLRGPLNTLVLEQALSEIVRRHEVLRTTFPYQDEDPRQVIGAAKPMILPIIDLAEIGEKAEPHARRLISGEAERPFNLAKGPLLRVKMLKLAAEDHIMTVMMQHIITDGWSLELLVGEFVALYEAYGNGRASFLPELELQYADFAVWQREWLQGEVLDEGLRYWKKELSGELPIIEFPGARQRPRSPSHKGDDLTFFIPSEISEGFKEICRAESVTMFMALLAAFDILLHKYTGHEDIVIGAAIAGRTRAETERMMGMFINMLPLRVDLRGRPSYKEVLKRVKVSTTGGYAYQDIPIEKVIEELGMERRSGQAPFIQIAFGLETVPEVEMKLPNLELESFSFDQEAVRFDLTVWLKETAKGMRSTWAYRTELFDAKLIAQMHYHFVTLLKNILAAPDAELADLEILTEEEKKEEVARGKAREQSRYERLLAAKHKAIKPSYR